MPTDLPLDTIISQVILRTPRWVWAVLLVITVIGVRQLVSHVVTTRRLTTVPVVLGAFSLWGTVAAFGAYPQVLLAWAAGMALVIAVNQQLAWPRQVEPLGEGRYRVAGSVMPLLAMWGVFGVRYVTNVTLALHPGLAHGTLFSLVMPAVYGALSGLFAARALRILRNAPAAGPLQLA